MLRFHRLASHKNNLTIYDFKRIGFEKMILNLGKSNG